jgi:AcrR family transcriptional regulator
MTRQLLLDRGLELFEEKGYPATTVDDIAAAAGTTRATFYLHFPSKADLMRSLVETTDDLLTRADVPPLPEVVRSGNREQIRTWLDRKFDQWAEIRPYVTAAHQAAASEPDIQKSLDQWFESAIGDIVDGLNAAERFDPATRRVRGALAFGQLEFYSRRWFQFGWIDDRATSLEVMTDSWCGLLTEER